jgi:hypothetical protein
MTSKIIAISVWGNNPRYSIGAIRNCELAALHFPDWVVRIYYDDTVNAEHIDLLKAKNNVELVDCTNLRHIAPCFWRFLAAFESEDNIIISRDSDSRLSERERNCIDEWLGSEKKYSVIRDHVRHYDFPMLAGMWGVKGKLSDILHTQMLDVASSNNYYTIDQVYLRDYVWPFAKDNVLISGILENKHFSETREFILPHFVGQGYDETENPIYPNE